MNEYMLVYLGGDRDWMETKSKEELAESMERWGAWLGRLEKAGQLISGGSPLHYTGKAVSNDGMVTDLLGAEIKELVSGYSLIKARDETEAVAIAKECPVLEYPGTSLQVRPVMNMEAG